MDVRIFWKGDGWRITVDHATKLVADDWAEVDAFMKKLLAEKEDKKQLTSCKKPRLRLMRETSNAITLWKEKAYERQKT